MTASNPPPFETSDVNLSLLFPFRLKPNRTKPTKTQLDDNNNTRQRLNTSPNCNFWSPHLKTIAVVSAAVPDLATGSIEDTSYDYTWMLDDVNDLKVHGVAFEDDGVFEFAFETKDGMWAAMGIYTSGSMADGDFWFCGGDEAYDANLIGSSNGRPDLDATDNILANGTSFFSSGGRSVCRIRRNIDTGDSTGDKVITSGRESHVIAHGAIDGAGYATGYEKHLGSQRSRVTIDLINASPSLSASSVMVAVLALIGAVAALF